MCYGMGCRFENYDGECRKPWREACPVWEEELEEERRLMEMEEEGKEK